MKFILADKIFFIVIFFIFSIVSIFAGFDLGIEHGIGMSIIGGITILISICIIHFKKESTQHNSKSVEGKS